MKQGRRIAVDLDLAEFFDNVEHGILSRALGRTIADKRLLALIGRYLRAAVMVGEHLEPSEIGTPQGGPLSPLLANILLDRFDRELHRREHGFVRYADDPVILVKSRRAGARVMRSITRHLTRTLKLPVNPAKGRVAPMSECGFLGFTIKGKTIRWTDKAEAKFKRRVKELTARSRGVSKDEWIRRRVRMCHWKQLRWARTKIRHLLELSVSRKTAIQHGVSSKSYWHMARTPALQQALSNAWLKAQGLVSVTALWCRAQGCTA